MYQSIIDDIIRTEYLKPNKRVVLSEILKIDHPSDIASPHLLYKNEHHNNRLHYSTMSAQ
jgi:hypothetical protein